MGIPGILKEIGKGERVALSKLAIEHLERHNRPLRVAIDAAIWNFQTQSGQGGKNPALRTLFFRLLRLLALPIQPVFVYDGKNKPLTKRGRTVTRYNGTCLPNELSKGLVRKFCYPWHTAPGEAEAECALLQKKGIVDAVMTQDVDAIMFGAAVTLRDWSKEGARGNKGPTHVNLMDSKRLTEISGLDSDGMILVALLSGGDYDEAGVPGFGAALACEIARAGFGKDLIECVKNDDLVALREWRERLQYELETNESGYFKRRHKTLQVPDAFPNTQILSYYLKPAVSDEGDLPRLEATWKDVWQTQIDVPELREYTANMFDWTWRSGARRFVRCFAQPIFQDRLRRGTVAASAFTISNITERRQHFQNDGIPELRFTAVPAEIVNINIETEEDNPEYANRSDEGDEQDVIDAADEEMPTGTAESQTVALASPSKRKMSPPWDAYAPEKWWIPETLLQLGLPEIVEDWQQEQREIYADPKKFANRKAPKQSKSSKFVDPKMHSGAIRGFFPNVEKTAKRGRVAQSSIMADNPEEGLSTEFSATNAGFPTVKPGRANHNKAKAQSLVSHEEKSLIKPPKYSRSTSLDSVINSIKAVNDQKATTIHQAVQEIQKPGRDPSGSSFSTAITIESSPVATVLSRPSSPPITNDRVDYVTQRSPRRTKARLRKFNSSPPTSPSRGRRPIESFFIEAWKKSHAQDTCDSTPPVIAAMPAGKPHLIDHSGESSQISTSSRRAAAVARDSLPGTWKGFDDDHTPGRRAPRVSFFDLTND